MGTLPANMTAQGRAGLRPRGSRAESGGWRGAELAVRPSRYGDSPESPGQTQRTAMSKDFGWRRCLLPFLLPKTVKAILLVRLSRGPPGSSGGQ